MADVYLVGRAAPRSWRIAHFGQKKTQNKFSTENRLIECPALNMAPGPTIQPSFKFPVRNSETAPVSDKIFDSSDYIFARGPKLLYLKISSFIIFCKEDCKQMKLKQADVKECSKLKIGSHAGGSYSRPVQRKGGH